MLIQERQDFPGGPLQVPGDAQPSLRMQWSMTTWISFDNPMYPRPEKSLIVRKYLPDDSSSLSCWAWYAKVSPGVRVPRRVPLSLLATV